MIKEIIICVIIGIIIIGLEIYTQNFIEKSVSDVSKIFVKIKENILKNDFEKINNELENLNDKWEEKQKKLAYYIEHDELEKVHTAIVTMKSYIFTEDFSSAIAELEKGKFVLEHIQEKNAFNLQNIF